MNFVSWEDFPWMTRNGRDLMLTEIVMFYFSISIQCHSWHLSCTLSGALESVVPFISVAERSLSFAPFLNKTSNALTFAILSQTKLLTNFISVFKLTLCPWWPFCWGVGQAHTQPVCQTQTHTVLLLSPPHQEKCWCCSLFVSLPHSHFSEHELCIWLIRLVITVYGQRG